MLNFQPHIGSVVFCNYDGFLEPEMIKKRPVIVVSKHKHNSKLVCVVPISTTEPNILCDYHLEMDVQFCALNLNSKKSWVKCDMVNVVCLQRLNLVRNKETGIRSAPAVSSTFLSLIKEAIKKAHHL